jgi:hypothetical protein
MIFATVALLVLFLGVTIPLLSALERTALLSAPALAVGVALICGGLFTSGFDAGHPRPDNLFYALEGTSGRALWLSSDSELDPWTEHFFQAGQPRRKVPELFGAESPLYWTSPAPALVQSPDVQVVADGQNADVRSVELRITSRRQAPKLTVSVEAAEVLRASVQERPISTCSTRPQKRWRLNAYGFGHGDLRVALQLPAGKPFRVTVIDTSYGLPEAGIQARPAGLMTQPFLSSDTTNAFQFVEFK